MSEICWFCKKNPSSAESDLVRPFYKETKSKVINVQKYSSTTRTVSEIHFIKERVIIPRCASCASIHKTDPVKVRAIKNKWQVIVTIVFIALALGIAFLLSTRTSDVVIFLGLLICCLFPIVLAAGLLTPMWVEARYWTLKGIRSESDWTFHPDVQNLKKSGWRNGEEPPSHVSIQM